MAYEVRVNQNHIWFSPLTSHELEKITTQGSTNWQSLAQQMEQRITTPSNLSNQLKRLSVLRPLIYICWFIIVAAAIAVVVANGIVFKEATQINDDINEIEQKIEDDQLVQMTPDAIQEYLLNGILYSANKQEVSEYAGFALGMFLLAIILVVLVLWLSRWSEKAMRDKIRHEVNRILSAHLSSEQYLLLDQVVLQQPGLNFERSKVPVQLTLTGQDGNQEEAQFKQLKSPLRELTKRPGLGLFKLFFVEPEVLKHPEMRSVLDHYSSHLQQALDEQRLKVLSYVKGSHVQMLCQELFNEIDSVRDLQATVLTLKRKDIES